MIKTGKGLPNPGFLHRQEALGRKKIGKLEKNVKYHYLLTLTFLFLALL